MEQGKPEGEINIAKVKDSAQATNENKEIVVGETERVSISKLSILCSKVSHVAQWLFNYTESHFYLILDVFTFIYFQPRQIQTLSGIYFINLNFRI